MGHVVKAALVSAGLCILLAACVSTTPGNPLLGDWVVDLPTTPRAHGTGAPWPRPCGGGSARYRGGAARPMPR